MIIAIGTLSLACALDPEPPRPVVDISISSPQAGTAVSPGSAIQWVIRCVAPASPACYGVAGVSVDLVQGPSNPVFFDLPEAAAVPPEMSGFSRPQGICNPVPGNLAASAYTGTRTGLSGSMNLVQIGGMQNTFGVAGTLMGTDTLVETGVGQDSGGQVIAEGVFSAPSEPGEYCFEIQNAVVNVLRTQAAMSGIWPVAYAEVMASSSVFCIAVEAGPTCDYTQDGVADQEDVAYLIDVVAGGLNPNEVDPDFNQDGVADQADVAALVDAIAGGAC